MRLHHQVADQIQSLAKVESLASEVYKLAALDQLTGLYNRRSGEQRLAQEIGRAQRYGRPLTVLLVDVDGLKLINDNHGHAAGDTLLPKVLPIACNVPFAAPISPSASAAMNSWPSFPNAAPKKSATFSAASKVSEFDFAGDKIRLHFSRGWTDYKAR